MEKDMKKKILNKYTSLYLESFIPDFKTLKKVKSIKIKISNNINKKFTFIKNKNSVNAHLFKPYYVLKENNIICYCATKIIAKQVIKAWNEYFIFSKKINFLKKTHYFKPSTNVIYNNLSLHLLSKIPKNEDVVIAKIDSFHSFIRLYYLYNFLNISLNIIKKISTEIELGRLKNNLFYSNNQYIFKKHLTKSDFLKMNTSVRIKNFKKGRYIIAADVTFINKKMTLVNLPWGWDLSYVLTKNLLKTNKNIKRLYVVGGVASLIKGSRVDDIFLPTSTTNTTKLNFNNNFLNNFKQGRNELSPSKLFKKRVFSGNLYCVDSSIGHEDDFVENCIANDVQGFDMESYGIIKAISNINVNIFFINYIMDLPHQNLCLGATYYYKPFLKKLFSRFNRGKYFCFDNVLNIILDTKLMT